MPFTNDTEALLRAGKTWRELHARYPYPCIDWHALAKGFGFESFCDIACVGENRPEALEAFMAAVGEAANAARAILAGDRGGGAL